MSGTLHRALDLLWLEYGTDPGIEKNSAAQYFYELQAPALNQEVFGTPFCKLAGATGKSPWVLADEIANNLPALRVLSKTASDPQFKELAQFYVDWADHLEKAAFLGRAARWGKSLFQRGAKAAPKATPKPTAPVTSTGAAASRTGAGVKVPVRSSEVGNVTVTSGGGAVPTSAPAVTGGTSTWRPRSGGGAPAGKAPVAKPQHSAFAKGVGVAALSAPIGLAGYYGLGLNKPSVPAY